MHCLALSYSRILVRIIWETNWSLLFGWMWIMADNVEWWAVKIKVPLEEKENLILEKNLLLDKLIVG